MLTGKKIGHYQIVEKLGQGGMGMVFRAVDEKLQRNVVLKMMHPGLLADGAFVRRFRKEGVFQAQLKHSNIIDVYSLYEDAAGLFIVMEYIAGESLAHRLKTQGALPWQQAVPMLEQALKALRHAHKKGVIHRDIKPDNMMLDREGSLKIGDFGIATSRTNALPATASQNDLRLTRTHATAGTLAYASPEQLKSLKSVDERSDIYSLGMAFYEALTGRLPFNKNDARAEVRAQIIAGKIPSPRKFNRDIPRPLAAIIQKAIHKNPEKRYQSARDMALDIRAFRQTHPCEDAHKTTLIFNTPQKQEKSRSRRYSRKTGAALAMLLVCALFMGVYYQLPSFFSENNESRKISVQSHPADALVYLDGNVLGVTPFRDYTLRANGPLQLRVLKDGYLPLDTTIAAAGPSPSLSFQLKAAATVAINAYPADAVVKINNVSQPADVRQKMTLPAGRHRVQVEKAGYQPVEKWLHLQAGQNAPVAIKLQSIEVQKSANNAGSVFITSRPAGAEIWIDGQRVSNAKTPTTVLELAPGNHPVLLKKGALQYRGTLTIAADRRANLDAYLQASTGQVSILALPYGNIFIDGERKKENAHRAYTVALPVGEHRIRITHPMHGQWEKKVHIRAGETLDLAVDFNRVIDVRITAFDNSGKPLNGEIFIDGESTGFSTPQKLPLRIGQHRIEVRKSGYQASGQPMVIHLEKELENPIKFILARK